MRHACLAYPAGRSCRHPRARFHRIEVRMAPGAPIKLARDVAVLEIPAGTPSTLPAGSVVRIMQSLGGSYTVAPSTGGMYRVDAKDADALGIRASDPPPA